MVRIELAADLATNAEPREDLIALDEALDRLAAQDPLKAELVKLRYFAGLTLPEAAGRPGAFGAHGGSSLGVRPRPGSGERFEGIGE